MYILLNLILNLRTILEREKLGMSIVNFKILVSNNESQLEH